MARADLLGAFAARGLAIGILIGALTVGSATPHLIRGVTDLPWRSTLLAASVLALLSALIVARVFLADSLAVRGGGTYAGLNASAATFLVIASGALGCWLGGVLADRWGRTSETIAAMALSGLCALVIGLTFGGIPALTLVVAIVWGIAVIADSAQFSTAVTELSPAAYVGTALTVQTCVGFSITILSIWLIPLIAQVVGWRWGFAALAPGPLLGIVAMARLRTLPESVKLAGGRR